MTKFRCVDYGRQSFLAEGKIYEGKIYEGERVDYPARLFEEVNQVQTSDRSPSAAVMNKVMGEQYDKQLTHTLGLSQTSEGRKRQPMFRGLLAYFPDACAAVSEVSFLGNEKHNPGEPMHHARSKSGDELDCVVRHATEAGHEGDPGRYILTADGKHEYGTPVLHSAALAWRALSNLQKEIEEIRRRETGEPGMARGARK